MYINDTQFEKIVFNGKKLNDEIIFVKCNLVYLESPNCKLRMSNQTRLNSIRINTIEFRKLLELKHEIINKIKNFQDSSVNMDEL
jgi:hypothetical protein